MDKTKEFYDSHKSYYNNCKIVLSMIGQWPYQSTASSILALGITLLLGPTFIIPQMTAVYELRASISEVLEYVMPIFINVMCTIKILNLMIKRNKIKKLLTDLAEDWANIKSDQELQILHNHTKFAATINNFYIIYLALVTFGYMLILQFSTIKLKILPGTNKSIGLDASPFIADYHIDEEKYYHLIKFHLNATIFFHAVMTIAPELLFIMLIQHACGMFEIIRYQLQTAVEDGSLNINLYPETKYDTTYNNLSNIIKAHTRIIHFTQQIETLFATSLLFSVLLIAVMISISTVQALVFSEEIDKFAKTAGLSLAQVLYIFLECWQAQLLTDAANRVHHHTYDCRWYRMSLRCRKLIILIMIRTEIPCKITAGRFMTFSLEAFSAVIRTSVSYIAVFRSIG
ncbi:odorant receptor 13a-like [Prorops nasuta]|uniref:odorant receptor 13a-like n=1 Tax=Prorops nasuta TaxID=863751 RepID=UPI0034CFFA02